MQIDRMQSELVDRAKAGRMVEAGSMGIMSLSLCVLFWIIGIGALEAGQKSPQQMLQQPENIPLWLEQKAIRFDEIPDPHWKDEGCIACHKKMPVGKQLYLRGKSIDEGCEYCHRGKLDHSFIHPSGIALSTQMYKRVSKEFKTKLASGRKLSCNTCHAIEIQCLQNHKPAQWTNPMFFRSGPYRARTDICYQCHDSDAYARRNAHDQIDDNGKINEKSCLICHNKLDGLKSAGSIQDVGFNYRSNLVRVCASCHDLYPHPSGNFTFTKKGTPNHLVIPPDDIRTKMIESEKERGVVLPLDPNTGRVFCGTCHNPHEKGVIKTPAAAKGADEEKRLRTTNICTNCHDK